MPPSCADILWRHDNGQVAVWHMRGGTWLSDRQIGGPDAARVWTIQAAGDFNGTPGRG